MPSMIYLFTFVGGDTSEDNAGDVAVGELPIVDGVHDDEVIKTDQRSLKDLKIEITGSSGGKKEEDGNSDE